MLSFLVALPVTVAQLGPETVLLEPAESAAKMDRRPVVFRRLMQTEKIQKFSHSPRKIH